MKNLSEVCQGLFGLQFPPGREDLDKRYRQLCLKGPYRHPDLGGTHDSFTRLGQVYSEMKTYCSLKTPEYATVLRTREGTLISDLGKGLGNTVNGVSCEQCRTKGYVIRSFQVPDPNGLGSCSGCEGRGLVRRKSSTSMDCRSCRGSGRFKTFSGFNVVCKTCGGKGKWTKIFTDLCMMCFGLGEARGYVFKEEYVTCFKCEGSGEIRIMNPVIQKGAIF